MQHFPEQIWIDFVHGVSSPEAMHEVQSHLEKSCMDCKAEFGLWSQVASFARREDAFTPPADLVRLAKLEFISRRWAEPEEFTLADMIFDSMAQPLTAGIRSGVASMRHFVYEAEGLNVHLSFEHRADSGTIFATGQVLDKDAPLSWLDNAAIVLWSDKGQVVATAEVNGFGEFQMQFMPQDHLRISIASAGRRTLRIPLGPLA